MHLSQTVSPASSEPMVIKDRSPFYRGFMVGSLVAIAVYAAMFARLLELPGRDVNAALAVIDAHDPFFAGLAVARAQEINFAAAAYVENCGQDLAARAWREAGDAQARYQLLSSYIAFSPESFTDC